MQFSNRADARSQTNLTFRPASGSCPWVARSDMNIDVHAHYVPPDSLKLASEIGRSHGLELDKNERGRAMVTRDGKPYLNQLKDEFSDLDLRLSIMDHQGVDMQA